MTHSPQYLRDVPLIKDGLEALIKGDSVFRDISPDLSKFDWPYYGPDFPALVRIVAGQQVSTSAAKAIWGRLAEAINPMTPETILAADDEDLRGCGFSRSKVAYAKGAAQALLDGRLDLAALQKMDDAAVAKEITALKGFGPWSAEIYLMFCLARPHIWPAGDLGIQEGLRRYLGQDERPNEAQTRAYAEKFAPHETAASLLLWYMKGLKQLATA